MSLHPGRECAVEEERLERTDEEGEEPGRERTECTLVVTRVRHQVVEHGPLVGEGHGKRPQGGGRVAGRGEFHACLADGRVFAGARLADVAGDCTLDVPPEDVEAHEVGDGPHHPEPLDAEVVGDAAPARLRDLRELALRVGRAGVPYRDREAVPRVPPKGEGVLRPPGRGDPDVPEGDPLEVFLRDPVDGDQLGGEGMGVLRPCPRDPAVRYTELPRYLAGGPLHLPVLLRQAADEVRPLGSRGGEDLVHREVLGTLAQPAADPRRIARVVAHPEGLFEGVGALSHGQVFR